MEKLLLVAGLARGIYGKWRFQQLLTSLAVLAGLTIVIAMMISALLIGGFQAAYGALLAQGFTPLMALGGVALLMLAVLALFALFAALYLQRVRRLLRIRKPANKACEMVDSFLDGFLADYPPR